MTLYFYDLETSGVNPRSARIMQFAGQRVDAELNPIGEPENILIKLTEDILPEPDAILVTGITPQQTLADGITEYAFLRYFYEHIATPDTVFIGYNNIRFDDEFLRFLHYRNFYDAYAWHWQDGRGRWDLLDAVRMTRALRPDGIEWPFAPDGTPSNRLELVAAVNKIDHTDAHDALSDVNATIALARLIRDRQPKLFDYLFSVRSKNAVTKLVQAATPFVYSSGRYPSEYEKTTVAVSIGTLENDSGAVVYDLRHNPAELESLSEAELTERLWAKRDSGLTRLPVKVLQFNRCPAIAPIGVLDEVSQQRLKLDMQQITTHLNTLKRSPKLCGMLLQVVSAAKSSYQTTLVPDINTVDEQLYEGFFDAADANTMRAVRAAEPADIRAQAFTFNDERLKLLLPLYKARNFPKNLSDEERLVWESFRTRKLVEGGVNSHAAQFFKRLETLAKQPNVTQAQNYILEELQLYAQSILPIEHDV